MSKIPKAAMPKNAKTLKLYRVALDQPACRGCGKKQAKLSTVRITEYDASHTYKGSKRPFQNIYSLKLCDKCFKNVTSQISKIIVCQTS